jgi:regulatory protein
MSDNESIKTALNKAMAACSRREHCRSEIVTMIESWGAEKSDSGKIIQLLIDENFINEERYAAAFVKDKFNYNKWGKVKISVHLKAKRIPDEIIKNALGSIDENNYLKMINDLISARRKSIKAKNSYDLKSKLLRYGLSKGFESHLLYDILNEIAEEE